MTRDEIITGLEREIKSIRMEPRRKMIGFCMTATEAEDVIALLKEQEPVEPKKKDDGNQGPCTCWWYVCGSCGRDIDPQDRFCRHCGQAAKWK